MNEVNRAKRDGRSPFEYAFRWSCYNGYLKVAKWLISIGADIYNVLSSNTYKIYKNEKFIELILRTEIKPELILDKDLRNTITNRLNNKVKECLGGYMNIDLIHIVNDYLYKK